MQTLDARFGTEELTIITTGCAHPPVVINQDSGASVVLGPARIDHPLPDHCFTVMNGNAQTTPGAFWGALAIAPEADAVRLHLIEGTEVSRCTVRRKVHPAAVQKQPPEQERRR
jgi:hypothetical protein